MSDIYGFTQDVQLPDSTTEEHAYCIEHAVTLLFDGDRERYDAVDRGDDTSCVDASGNSYTIIHEGTIQYEQFPSDFYPDGLFCFICGGEILPPQEEDD